MDGYDTIIWMNMRRIIFSVIAILFGVFMVVFGEKDDSPGAQGLGLLAVIIGVVGVLKSKKKKTH